MEDGNTANPSFKIFTHKKFEIGYNGNQIVDVNLTSDGRVKIQPGTKLSFSYEVSLRCFSFFLFFIFIFYYYLCLTIVIIIIIITYY